MPMSRHHDDRPPDLLDWLLLVPFLLALVTVFLAGEVAFRLTYPLGRACFDRVNGMWHTALAACLRIVGTRVIVRDRFTAPPGVPLIFVANHQSLFDVPILASALRRHRPRFVAKRSLGRGIPTISFGLRMGPSALIDRDDPRQSMRAILALGRVMAARGFGVLMFPEGRRARDGRLQPFQAAGVAALLRTAPAARVVPIAVDGSWRLFRHGFRPLRRGTTITVLIDEPVAAARDDAPAALTEAARITIARALDAWRARALSRAGRGGMIARNA